MSKRVLVLHGPNLPLILEREGESLAALDRRLRERAKALELDLTLLHSTHEGRLVETLHAACARGLDGILVAPGALALGGHVLAEAIALCGVPTLEVHVGPWKGRTSVLRPVCQGSIAGHGPEGYFEALERLAAGEEAPARRTTRTRTPPARKEPAGARKEPASARTAGKTLGRRAAIEAEPASSRPAKTLGRGAAKSSPTRGGASRAPSAETLSPPPTDTTPEPSIPGARTGDEDARLTGASSAAARAGALARRLLATARESVSGARPDDVSAREGQAGVSTARPAEPEPAPAAAPSTPARSSAKTLGRKPAAESEPTSALALATPAPLAKSLGRGAPSAPESSPPAKSLGRAAPAAPETAGSAGKSLGRATPSAAAPAGVLSREQVRAKIADRLSGRLTPAGLSTWARAQWLEVQRGAPAESGQRELLEDTLQQLTLSTLPATRLTDDQLVELMAQLDQ